MLPDHSMIRYDGPRESTHAMLTRVARCRVILTGSYHAAVFGLAMGIPSVCFTRSAHYHFKMTGLLDMFEAAPDQRVISLDDPQAGRKLAQAVQEAWENAETERAGLIRAAAQQIARGQVSYASIFDLIDTRAAEGESLREPRFTHTLTPALHGHALFDALEARSAKYELLEAECRRLQAELDTIPGPDSTSGSPPKETAG